MSNYAFYQWKAERYLYNMSYKKKLSASEYFYMVCRKSYEQVRLSHPCFQIKDDEKFYEEFRKAFVL